jgi:hypothetical protein
MNTPEHKLGIAMKHLLEQGKRPCFRLEGLRITMAANDSRNPGSLYIKDEDWNYIGKISPKGFLKIMYPSKITNEQKLLVIEAIKEPESTAMNRGKVTGTCCCCGRKLTNKLSIELGIGPICRGLWFPNLEQLDLGLDDPQLDLGLYTESSFDSEQFVKVLATSYFNLTLKERDMFNLLIRAKEKRDASN